MKRKKLITRRLASYFIAFCLSTALFACGGGTDDTTTSSNTTSSNFTVGIKGF